jgi:hypothetical protein
LKAAYPEDEIERLLQETLLKNAVVKTNPTGLEIVGKK